MWRSGDAQPQRLVPLTNMRRSPKRRHLTYHLKPNVPDPQTRPLTRTPRPSSQGPPVSVCVLQLPLLSLYLLTPRFFNKNPTLFAPLSRRCLRLSFFHWAESLSSKSQQSWFPPTPFVISTSQPPLRTTFSDHRRLQMRLLSLSRVPQGTLR